MRRMHAEQPRGRSTAPSLLPTHVTRPPSSGPGHRRVGGGQRRHLRLFGGPVPAAGPGHRGGLAADVRAGLLQPAGQGSSTRAGGGRAGGGRWPAPAAALPGSPRFVLRRAAPLLPPPVQRAGCAGQVCGLHQEQPRGGGGQGGGAGACPPAWRLRHGSSPWLAATRCWPASRAALSVLRWQRRGHGGRPPPPPAPAPADSRLPTMHPPTHPLRRSSACAGWMRTWRRTAPSSAAPRPAPPTWRSGRACTTCRCGGVRGGWPARGGASGGRCGGRDATRRLRARLSWHPGLPASSQPRLRASPPTTHRTHPPRPPTPPTAGDHQVLPRLGDAGRPGRAARLHRRLRGAPLLEARALHARGHHRGLGAARRQEGGLIAALPTAALLGRPASRRTACSRLPAAPHCLYLTPRFDCCMTYRRLQASSERFVGTLGWLQPQPMMDARNARLWQATESGGGGGASASGASRQGCRGPSAISRAGASPCHCQFSQTDRGRTASSQQPVCQALLRPLLARGRRKDGAPNASETSRNGGAGRTGRENLALAAGAQAGPCRCVVEFCGSARCMWRGEPCGRSRHGTAAAGTCPPNSLLDCPQEGPAHSFSWRMRRRCT